MSQSPSRLVSLFEAAVELAHTEERARFLERIQIAEVAPNTA
jgi:hypothetical protein